MTMVNTYFHHFLLTILIVLLASIQSLAQEDISQFYNISASSYNVEEDKVAIQGYDLIAYHTTRKALPGSSEWSYSYDSILYYFVSAAHRDLFAQNPAKYLPAYGGYCAYGVGMDIIPGKYMPGKYPIDPKSFKIIQDTLHLFYNEPEFNALEYWDQNKANLKVKADERWGKIPSNKRKK
ncbi:MAG: YHS domain protein [Bacteroidia bacterium]|nr:YHS domain protein [Bacteroidia bacterium]